MNILKFHKKILKYVNSDDANDNVSAVIKELNNLGKQTDNLYYNLCLFILLQF